MGRGWAGWWGLPPLCSPLTCPPPPSEPCGFEPTYQELASAVREEYPDIEIESRLGGTGKAAGGPAGLRCGLGDPHLLPQQCRVSALVWGG